MRKIIVIILFIWGSCIFCKGQSDSLYFDTVIVDNSIIDMALSSKKIIVGETNIPKDVFRAESWLENCQYPNLEACNNFNNITILNNDQFFGGGGKITHFNNEFFYSPIDNPSNCFEGFQDGLFWNYCLRNLGLFSDCDGFNNCEGTTNTDHTIEVFYECFNDDPFILNFVEENNTDFNTAIIQESILQYVLDVIQNDESVQECINSTINTLGYSDDLDFHFDKGGYSRSGEGKGMFQIQNQNNANGGLNTIPFTDNSINVVPCNENNNNNSVFLGLNLFWSRYNHRSYYGGHYTYLSKFIEIEDLNEYLMFDFSFIFGSQNVWDNDHSPKFWIELYEIDETLNRLNDISNLNLGESRISLGSDNLSYVDGNYNGQSIQSIDGNLTKFMDWTRGSVNLEGIDVGKKVIVNFIIRTEVPELTSILIKRCNNSDFSLLDFAGVYIDNIQKNSCARVPSLEYDNQFICADEQSSGNDGIAYLSIFDYESYDLNDITLELSRNDDDFEEITDWNIIEGTNQIPIDGLDFYPIPGCPIDCNNPYIKYTNYKFRIRYRHCFDPTSVEVTSDEISIDVYPPLREDPYYSETTHPGCYRDNVLVTTVQPCNGGSNGQINIDTDCIIGGIQNRNGCSKEICVNSSFKAVGGIQAVSYGINVTPSIVDLPTEFVIDQSNSYINILAVGDDLENFDGNQPSLLVVNTLPISETAVIQPQTVNIAFGEGEAYLKIQLQYHLEFTNGDIVDFETEKYTFKKETRGNSLNYYNITPKNAGSEDCQPIIPSNVRNGIYSFELWRDEEFSPNGWEEQCAVKIDQLDGEECGTASFNKTDRMIQGDYKLYVESVLGCPFGFDEMAGGSSAPLVDYRYTTIIPLFQLDMEAISFDKNPYYWCEPEDLTLTVLPNPGAAYNIAWNFKDGIESIDGVSNAIKLLPYHCLGGDHSVKITRLAVNTGEQDCIVELTTKVVDFNPPLVLDQYEDAIGIGAAKYKSVWLTDFNDLQVSNPGDLKGLRDRNPYATGQAGIFRGYQSYDYLDIRRQFQDRTGQLVYNDRDDLDNYQNTELETVLKIDGVIGMPNENDQTLTKGFAYNHPKLEDCAPEWKFNSEITKYNSYNYETENKDVLGRYSAALYGYDGQLSIGVAANAAHNEIAFENFEEYVGGFESGTLTSNTEFQLPMRFYDINSSEELLTFESDGAAQLLVTINNNLFDCDFTMTNQQAQVSFYIGDNWVNALLAGALDDFTHSLSTNISGSTTHTFNEQVSQGNKLFASVSGMWPFSSSNSCWTETSFIEVDWNLTGNQQVHQFNNATGNFDFVNQNFGGEKEFLTSYNVQYAFGHYAVIDRLYDAVCEPTPDDPNSNRIDIKYAAESIEVECGDTKYNIQEVVGDKTISVKVLPDPCESNYSMIKFDESSDVPGFSIDNDKQFWNGYVYEVKSKQVSGNVKNLQRGVSFVQSQSHTGMVSMQIGNVNTDPVEFSHHDLVLKPGKTYVISAWIRVLAFDNMSPIELRAYNISNKIGLDATIGDMPKQFFAAKGNVIEGWQKVESEITAPSGGGVLTISFDPTELMWVDDIRIHPKNGGMQTYVYDLQRYRLQATLDHNNYATFYKYDDEGNLFHVAKETMEGIKTIQVSSAYIKPNTAP